MKYLVVIEETKTGYSAYSPDIIGCVSAGSTKQEVEQRMKEAIEFHLAGLQKEGYTLEELEENIKETYHHRSQLSES